METSDTSFVVKTPEPRFGFLQKLPKPKIILPLLFLPILGIGLYFAVTLAQKSQTISSRAAPASSKINLIVKLVKDPATGQITVENAVANRGYFPKYPQSPAVTKDELDVLEQVTNNKTVASYAIQFTEYIYLAPPVSDEETPFSGMKKFLEEKNNAGASSESSDTSPELLPPDAVTAQPQPSPGGPDLTGAPIKLPKPEAVISIPFDKTSSLQIRNSKTKTAQSLVSAKITQAVLKVDSVLMEKQSAVNDAGTTVNPTSPNTVAVNDGYLDILFIASHYTDFNQFHSDVDAMINQLLKTSPFANYKNNIRATKLDNTQDLGCFRYSPPYERALSCDDTKVIQVASQVPYDTIIVIENTDTYGGSARLGRAVTYRNVAESATRVFVHELGHSLLKLGDEYSYRRAYTEPNPPSWANASYSPCKWAGTPDTGCFLISAFTNLYRPTDNNNIMKTLYPDGGFKFDLVSQAAIKPILLSYLPTPPPSPFPDYDPKPKINIITSPTCFVYNENQSITVEYKDPDGANNIQYAYLTINSTNDGNATISPKGALKAVYNPANGDIFFLKPDGSGWLSPNIYDNGYAAIDKTGTTATQNGDTLTINWKIKFLSSWEKESANIYVRALDKDKNWSSTGKKQIDIPCTLPACISWQSANINGCTLNKWNARPRGIECEMLGYDAVLQFNSLNPRLNSANGQQMRIAVDANPSDNCATLPDAKFLPWETYSSTKNISLTPRQEGNHKVCVQFKNTNGESLKCGAMINNWECKAKINDCDTAAWSRNDPKCTTNNYMLNYNGFSPADQTRTSSGMLNSTNTCTSSLNFNNWRPYRSSYDVATPGLKNGDTYKTCVQSRKLENGTTPLGDSPLCEVNIKYVVTPAPASVPSPSPTTVPTPSSNPRFSLPPSDL